MDVVVKKLVASGKRWERLAEVSGGGSGCGCGWGVLLLGLQRVEKCKPAMFTEEMAGLELEKDKDKDKDEDPGAGAGGWIVAGRRWAGVWGGVMAGLVTAVQGVDGGGQLGGEQPGGRDMGAQIETARNEVLAMMAELKGAWRDARGLQDGRRVKRARVEEG